METCLPLGFTDEMRALLDARQADALLQALDIPAVTGVRVNTAKGFNIDGQPVAWCRQGRVLGERPQFTLMPEWHAGCFYVQEPASMVISTVVQRLTERIGRPDLRYLDICAAPGGKTTAALAALPAEAFVVANEFVPARAKILVENLIKWGYPNVAVTCGDTGGYRSMRSSFDIVAVDAPCSGEGMMRKEEEARRQWSHALVKQCAELQREILNNAWHALRPGGYLIYSTCTFNRHENEDMLLYAVAELGAESVDLGIAADFCLPTSLEPGIHALRFMPHLTCGEGLFLGVLHKPGSTEARRAAKTKSKKRGCKKGTTISEVITRLLMPGREYAYKQDKAGVWRVIPAGHALLIAELEQSARLLFAGVALGEMKGKDFIPDAALALSTELAPGAFPSVEVEREAALDYLRREAPALPAGTPKGHVLISHNGHPLGFVKNLGNRANNLYPQTWRIRFL